MHFLGAKPDHIILLFHDQCLRSYGNRRNNEPGPVANDPDIVKKINKLKDELKQSQMQLIDVPLEFTNEMSEEELNRYFNSPKVQKKYRLKG